MGKEDCIRGAEVSKKSIDIFRTEDPDYLNSRARMHSNFSLYIQKKIADGEDLFTDGESAMASLYGRDKGYSFAEPSESDI